MKPQEISKWKGIWRDDKERYVKIDYDETPEGLAQGFFLPMDDLSQLQHYRDGNHTLDGSKLMERKRGDEKGWPL